MLIANYLLLTVYDAASLLSSATVVYEVGCVAQLAERRSLAGELTLSYARPAADG